jgi:hypothetical protein
MFKELKDMTQEELLSLYFRNISRLALYSDIPKRHTKGIRKQNKQIRKLL